MLILLISHPHFDIQHIETDYRIMHKLYKALDLLYYLIEKLFVLKGKICTCRVYFKETHIFLYIFRLLLDVDFENFTEVIL